MKFLLDKFNNKKKSLIEIIRLNSSQNRALLVKNSCRSNWIVTGDIKCVHKLHVANIKFLHKGIDKYKK